MRIDNGSGKEVIMGWGIITGLLIACMIAWAIWESYESDK